MVNRVLARIACTNRKLEVGRERCTWEVWSSHTDKMLEDGIARITLRLGSFSIDGRLEVGRARISCAGRISGTGMVRSDLREARRCLLGPIHFENFSTSRSWRVVCEDTILACVCWVFPEIFVY